MILKELLEATMETIKSAQDIVARYDDPDGIDECKAMELMTQLFDRPEQRTIEEMAREELSEAETQASNDGYKRRQLPR